MIIDRVVESMVYIYTLSDPRDGLIRYVGKTNNIIDRLYNHIGDINKNVKTHKTNWLKSLYYDNLRPIIQVIDFVPVNEWQFWETFWIHQLTTWGFSLTNHKEGGQGLTKANKTSFKKGIKVWNKGLKGRKLKPNKNVFQYSALTGEFIKWWNTAKEASINLNINEDGIGNCARGLSAVSGGYIWTYIRVPKVTSITYEGRTNNKLKNNLK